jgi:hypothetical protein
VLPERGAEHVSRPRRRVAEYRAALVVGLGLIELIEEIKSAKELKQSTSEADAYTLRVGDGKSYISLLVLVPSGYSQPVDRLATPFDVMSSDLVKG